MEPKKQISIRIEVDAFEKFQHISKGNNRSPSGQIKHWVYKSIWDFEAQHGKIELADTRNEVLQKY